jgi:hypothetical protein
MRGSHPVQFPLRLPASLKFAAKLSAEGEGISLNHFIALALAEKVERLQPRTALPLRGSIHPDDMS